jgi:hypothetical protein
MRVVARADALELLRTRGAVYVRPRAYRCCRGRQFVLEASLEPPPVETELVHAADGFRIYATPGLAQPDELHFELDGRSRIHAYWNNQAWIG